MSHTVSKFFTSADQNRIVAAVREAEEKTSGEIVPYVVGHSDLYEEAEWRAGGLFGVALALIVILLQTFTSLWLPFGLVQVLLVILLGGAIGMLLGRFVAPVKRFFAGKALLERRVAQRAAEAFIAEEVFKTRDRTGILIFLSLLERKVLVVGDAGINAKVAKNDWHDIVDRLVRGIRTGKPADGLIDAIEQCGQLLRRHGVNIRPDDKDELPDSLRLKDN